MTSAPSRRLARVALRRLGRLALLGVALVLLQNALLNAALLPLINRRPERLRIDCARAWMWIPGQVQVWGLSVRGQGLTDQWLITAGEVRARIALPEILERRVRISDVHASGLSLRYRRRLDRAQPEGDADAAGATALPEAANRPPIPGLSNPPDPDPEQIYREPRARWSVRLDDIQADDIHEIWIENYHLSGRAAAAVNLSLSDPFIDLDGALTVHGMRAEIGDSAVAEDIRGSLSILVDSMDRRESAAERLLHIGARVRGGLDVEDLRFLDVYLAPLPWLSVSGAGHIDLDATLAGGLIEQGSRFHADFPELLVRFRDEDISGAGRLAFAVVSDDDGLPLSRMTVDLDNFAVTTGASQEVLAEGEGFHVSVESPDVAISEPFTSARAVLELPESRIPDFAAYSQFLPRDIGLALLEGTGTVRGHLEASTEDARAAGVLTLRGDDVKVRFDTFTFTTDLALDAEVSDADLAEGRYTLAQSTLQLWQGRMVSRERAANGRGVYRWTAAVSLRGAEIVVGAPVYLDARVGVTCSDSSPLVEVFAAQRELPGWAAAALSRRDVRGYARLRLGQRQLSVDRCRISAGDYQVDLRFLKRDGRESVGDLLLSAGRLSLGVSLGVEGRALQLRDAAAWFEALPPW